MTHFTKDGAEVKSGDTVFTDSGEKLIVSGVSPQWRLVGVINPQSNSGVGGKGFSQYLYCHALFHSEKLALKHRLQQVTQEIWQAEQEAEKGREDETKLRLRLIELEKQEEEQRKKEEQQKQLESMTKDSINNVNLLKD